MDTLMRTLEGRGTAEQCNEMRTCISDYIANWKRGRLKSARSLKSHVSHNINFAYLLWGAHHARSNPSDWSDWCRDPFNAEYAARFKPNTTLGFPATMTNFDTNRLFVALYLGFKFNIFNLTSQHNAFLNLDMAVAGEESGRMTYDRTSLDKEIPLKHLDIPSSFNDRWQSTLSCIESHPSNPLRAILGNRYGEYCECVRQGDDCPPSKTGLTPARVLASVFENFALPIAVRVWNRRNQRTTSFFPIAFFNTTALLMSIQQWQTDNDLMDIVADLMPQTVPALAKHYTRAVQSPSPSSLPPAASKIAAGVKRLENSSPIYHNALRRVMLERYGLMPDQFDEAFKSPTICRIVVAFVQNVQNKLSVNVAPTPIDSSGRAYDRVDAFPSVQDIATDAVPSAQDTAAKVFYPPSPATFDFDASPGHLPSLEPMEDDIYASEGEGLSPSPSPPPSPPPPSAQDTAAEVFYPPSPATFDFDASPGHLPSLEPMKDDIYASEGEGLSPSPSPPPPPPPPRSRKRRKSDNVNAELMLANIELPAKAKTCLLNHMTTISNSLLKLKDICDNTERELAFYKQALSAASDGRKEFRKLKIPFSRPTDYFAEMVKSDEHMEKLKQKLVKDETAKKASQEARRQRELKKFGKKVQHAKLQERQKKMRETLDKIKSLKRKRANDSVSTDQFDVEIEDALRDKKQERDTKYKLGNSKRQAKDKKYGFGGKKSGSSRNTSESTMDISDFHHSRKQKRPGKSRRHK